MPRVLHITDSLGTGGAQRQLALLLKYLPPNWERMVWSLEGGPFVHVIRDQGIPVICARRRFRLDGSPVLGIWRVLARWRPDVVHSWSWVGSVASAPYCRVVGTPLIDGSIRMGMRPEHRAFPQMLGMRSSTYVIANSRAGLQAWNVGPARGHVVYNGFDPDRLPLCTAQPLPRYGAFTVVMTARMQRAKDFRSAISAIRSLTEAQGPTWRLLAIGAGPDRGELMTEARDLIERHVVEFADVGLEVLPLVRQADVGILMTDPTRHAEGCSNAILEYMACGLPVVCSESGGNRELVLDGQTGFIVPAGDVVELASRLDYLRREPAVARKMGLAGRERLHRAFSVDTMVAETVGLYTEALRRRRQGR